MTAVRRKRGRVVAMSAPSARAHGRLAEVAPASRADVRLADPAERFAFALVERAVVRRSGDAKQKRAAKQRADRARAALIAASDGHDEVRRIASALASCGGAVLRTVERAHADLREFAARAAVRLTALVREHDVTSTGALVLLGSAARWSALAEALHERAFVLGSGDETFATLVKLAQSSSNAARLDLLSALDLEQQSRARSERGPSIDVDARLREIQAERAAALAQPDDATAEVENHADAPADDASANETRVSSEMEGVGPEPPSPTHPPPSARPEGSQGPSRATPQRASSDREPAPVKPNMIVPVLGVVPPTTVAAAQAAAAASPLIATEVRGRFAVVAREELERLRGVDPSRPSASALAEMRKLGWPIDPRWETEEQKP